MSTASKEARAISGFFSSVNVKVRVPKKFQGAASVYTTDRVLSQDEAHKIVECASNLEEKLILCLIFQLGQRVGLLRALRYDMIKPLGWPEIKTFEASNWWGQVEIKADYVDYKGEPVGRKIKSHYFFPVHPESTNLILKVQKEQHRKDTDYILTLSIRDMQRIFDRCVKQAGLQKTEKHLRKKNEVYIHQQRAYFMGKMTRGGATQGLDTKTAEHFLDFLMGHKVPYDMTYMREVIQKGSVLEACRRAESSLCVLQLPSGKRA